MQVSQWELYVFVAGERSGQNRIKTHKDLMQAAALIALLCRDRSHELSAAWEDAWSRGQGWRKRLEQGGRTLLAAYPQSPLRNIMLKH